MQDCPIERRVLVKSGTLNMATGAMTYTSEAEQVRPCGTPLFGEDAKRGICSGCAKLWSAEGNRPTVAGLLAIAKKIGADSEFGVDDPKLGECSCDDESHARQYAAAVKGAVFLKLWRGGEEINKESGL